MGQTRNHTTTPVIRGVYMYEVPMDGCLETLGRQHTSTCVTAEGEKSCQRRPVLYGVCMAKGSVFFARFNLSLSLLFFVSFLCSLLDYGPWTMDSGMVG